VNTSQSRIEAEPEQLNSLASGFTVRSLHAAFRHALSDADLSEKAAAYQMGVDPSQLSRALHGDGHLYLDALPALGPRFQRTFLESWAEALGLRVISADSRRENLKALCEVLAEVLASER